MPRDAWLGLVTSDRRGLEESQVMQTPPAAGSWASGSESRSLSRRLTGGARVGGREEGAQNSRLLS